MIDDSLVETSDNNDAKPNSAVCEGCQVDTADPTTETYDELSRAFRIFNQRLFGGRLKPCLITLRGRGKVLGYFYPLRFVHEDGRRSHEIALNPNGFGSHTIEQCLSTLAHEMVHQAQFDAGSAGRRAYHNRDFARRMFEIGLHVLAPGGQSVGPKVSHHIAPDGAFMVVVRELLDANFRARWIARFVPEVCDDWVGGDQHVQPGASWFRPIRAPAHEEHGELPGHCGRSAGETEAPPMDDNPDVFAIAEQSGSKDSSKVKFACSRCKQAAWGRRGLNLVCGTCCEPMPVAA